MWVFKPRPTHLNMFFFSYLKGGRPVVRPFYFFFENTKMRCCNDASSSSSVFYHHCSGRKNWGYGFLIFQTHFSIHLKQKTLKKTSHRTCRNQFNNLINPKNGLNHKIKSNNFFLSWFKSIFRQNQGIKQPL